MTKFNQSGHSRRKGAQIPDDRRERAPDATDENADRIEGRNAVIEACRAGMTIEKLFVAAGRTDGGINRIVAMAKERGAVIVECERRRLDRMSVTGAHQGIIAQTAGIVYGSMSDMLAYAAERGDAPLIVVCDGIYDPGNLGAVIRSAEAAGAHGVVIPKRRSAAVGATAIKASAGAAMHMIIARETNITAALKELKRAGLWVTGTSPDADKLYPSVDFTGPTALVIGSEGEGMKRLVGEACDFSVAIPMKGKIASLNASAAAAVLLFEVVRQRGDGNG